MAQKLISTFHGAGITLGRKLLQMTCPCLAPSTVMNLTTVYLVFILQVAIPKTKANSTNNAILLDEY